MVCKTCTSIFLLAILYYVKAQGKTKDGLIKDVFGKNNDDQRVTKSPLRIPDLQPTSGHNAHSEGLPGTGTCTCVPYYLCNNGSVNTNGEGIIDIKIHDSTCENYTDVCCGNNSIANVMQTPTSVPRKRSGCGHRNPEGLGFRLTGLDNDPYSKYGEFPWVVVVLRGDVIEGSSQNFFVYQCGGALIHPQVVITAAHCVNNKNQYKIRAGEWDTQTKKELYPRQNREVSSITIHPQYQAGALYNDVALLWLDSPLEIAENVDVVCLPPQNLVVDNARCFASGWGKDVFGKDGKYQVLLKKVYLPIIPRDKCQEALRTTRLGHHFELHKSFICAGGEAGKDTCQGDGGSPLVCPIPGQFERYQQAGIVAWGIGCGNDKSPGVYVNLALFRDWIDQQMQLKNLETDTYICPSSIFFSVTLKINNFVIVYCNVY